jgi:hypothetical protein
MCMRLITQLAILAKLILQQEEKKRGPNIWKLGKSHYNTALMEKQEIQQTYTKTKTVSFEKWFLRGTRKYEKMTQNLNCLNLVWLKLCSLGNLQFSGQ